MMAALPAQKSGIVVERFNNDGTTGKSMTQSRVVDDDCGIFRTDMALAAVSHNTKSLELMTGDDGRRRATVFL